MVMYGVLVVAVLPLALHAGLVFPPGSDMGYIVKDEPLSDGDVFELVEGTEPVSEEVLQRAEREAVEDLETALLRSFEDRKARQLLLQAGDEPVKVEPRQNWGGEWFPTDPEARYVPPADLPDSLKDAQHGVVMGKPHIKCDNAKVNLTMDWDFSPVNFTCFDPKRHRLPVRSRLESELKCTDIPRTYSPKHICMSSKIRYNTTLPTFGPHRPIWPKYGEYTFVPVQRWLHTLEHGGIVMLYHPCAEPVLVHRLRKILKGCFRKHVITPYNLLTEDRPLALMAWGCSLEMATVDDEEVRSFIKTRALHGPEGHYPKDGGYKELLIVQAEYPPGAEEKDSNICPS